MEEYIYIILGVLWLAATIYRASKKKSTQDSPQKTRQAVARPEKPASTVQSLLDQLLEGQQLKVPEPEVVELEEEYAEPMLSELEKKKRTQTARTQYAGYGFNSIEALEGEGISSLGRITFVDQMKPLKKEGRGPVRINLRKAIIYKAILERPYLE
ncbi:MAG: hypothetical protein V2I47_09085 [Bacteroidales bacterium]|jgi:hypothetical protein|nr:hypothetical protein [Bacteroidales bacterium]